MKIHTTQNLTSNRPTNITVPQQVRYSNYNDSYAHSVSFMKKAPKNSENAKKIVESAKKKLEEIKDKATPESKKGDRLLKSSFFNWCLKLASFENIFSAVTAAVICIILRPLTIMALPDKGSKNKDKAEPKIEIVEKAPSQEEVKTDLAIPVDEKYVNNTEAPSFKSNKVSFKGKNNNKKERSAAKTNNMYASAQSIASGIAGVVTAVILTAPLKNGQDYVTKNMHKFLSKEKIKELYPWVRESSLLGKDGKLQEMGKWLTDKDGLAFKKDVNNCDMLPEFKKLADVSKETFEKILNLNIDFASQKGKSFNEVVTKDGKTLYDALSNFDKFGIKVKEEGIEDVQILFKDLDKKYLEKLIADSKGVNEWGNLDINSVYDGKDIVKDIKNWKTNDGKAWKPDFDSIYVTSELETANYKPRRSGKKRFDEKSQEWKFCAYQENGIDGRLGTEITNDMINADAKNTVHTKLLTWLPDLVFRVPVAVGTIALIPWVLKNVFGLEKAKPNEEKKADAVKEQAATVSKEQVSFKGKTSDLQNNNVSFKGKAPDPEKASGLTKFLAKWFGKKFLESPKMRKCAEWIKNLPGDTTEHMVVLGSVIQSGVYVNRTLSNKDLDNDKKKILALNQALCCVIPAIIGYTVGHFIGGFVKKVTYRYTGLMKEKIADLSKNGADDAAIKKAEEMSKNLGKNMKGVSALARLVSFTLIYRYLTPVVVTPVANAIGEKYLAKKKAKQESAQTL